MLNRLLRHFYKKVAENYGSSMLMYTIARDTVYKNFMECSNLADCFIKCKTELYL